MTAEASHSILSDSSADFSSDTAQNYPRTSDNDKIGIDYYTLKQPSIEQSSSIGLGLVVDKGIKERKRKYSTSNATFKGPPTSIALPPPPTIVFDSGTPRDKTSFPFSRHIMPLPSPSYINGQPNFTKHDIVSPFIPSWTNMPAQISENHTLPCCAGDNKDDTSIPVISLSPSFSSQQRMPNLSELPMLGDVDDDHFQDHGSLSVPPLMATQDTIYMMRERQSLLSPAIQTYDESTLIGKKIWKFRIKKLLGVGAFSKVYLATNLEEAGSKSAIKMIGKTKMLKDLRMKSSVEREVAVLQFLDHPSIIRLEATMEIEQHLCLVLEYVSGGELFDFVQHRHMLDINGQLNEPLVQDLFLQLTTTVQWIHQQNVVHRDLKLENILLYQDHGKLKLKISDFGLARVIDPQQPLLTTRCGSEEYAAPEIVQGIGYDGRLTDTWAIGVILYALLVGYLPFSTREGSSSISQLFYQIMQATVRWPKDTIIPTRAKHVVESLLHRQADKRIPLVDIPSLPWFRNEE